MDDLREEILKDLQENIMPFWMNLKDDEYGGFYGWVDYDLNLIKSTDKGGIATARYLWSFSSMYRFTKDEKYKECANHAYKFLLNNFLDKEWKGLYWMVDYKGNVTDYRKHVYTQSFGIYALSEYYRATGHEESLEMAKDLYYLIESKGFNNKNNAYMEEFNREWDISPNEMLSENGVVADITTNTHLHVLEAYTNLYRVWPDKELKENINKLIKIFYEYIYNKDTKFLKVFFDNKWNEIIDLKSYGHDIEASWLIDEALKVIASDNKEYLQMVVDIAYNIAKEGVLKDGSLKNEKEKGKDDLTKVWWVQAEAMVGFVNAYERTKDKKFLELVSGLWKYTKENVIDKRKNGEWYWSVEENNKPTEREIAGPWKTPYHNTRFCLEILERIDK
ncbi:AGE family epimerase/isomerase [Clostridium grantii]|uniref:Cellobiose 2-epimerase n=1 Tax=Clostridium grantii DSM 8605 TaxID=1121316 RepID=A0A1M5UB33_9CLOT|nr:AGE family epimerase/isomerase [Clostridium grantii]SHH60150.1 mannobiose 2-epimerase [Clostridium grantii DSM 8605]